MSFREKWKSDQTFTNLDEISTKGAPRHPKTNPKRSKQKDQELAKKSIDFGMNMGFSMRSSLG
jgi:hypothetical protein